jgi:hypothetical protein
VRRLVLLFEADSPEARDEYERSFTRVLADIRRRLG